MPDRSPGRLGDDRAEGISVEGLELGESLGAELSFRFLVRDDDERGGYAPIGAGPRGVDDRGEATLHVRRAAPDGTSVLFPGVELLR
jgi:hypothetical protein